MKKPAAPKARVAAERCAACIHIERCRWLLSRTGEETSCDWTPSRFALACEPCGAPGSEGPFCSVHGANPCGPQVLTHAPAPEAERCCGFMDSNRCPHTFDPAPAPSPSGCCTHPESAHHAYCADCDDKGVQHPYRPAPAPAPPPLCCWCAGDLPNGHRKGCLNVPAPTPSGTLTLEDVEIEGYLADLKTSDNGEMRDATLARLAALREEVEDGKDAARIYKAALAAKTEECERQNALLYRLGW